MVLRFHIFCLLLVCQLSKTIKVLLPSIDEQLENADRVDIILDAYLSSSIKGFAQKRRWKGIRRKVSKSNKKMARISPTPRQQTGAVCIPLSKSCFDKSLGRQNSWHEEHVIVRGNNLDMVKTDHEEADTRMVLHKLNALQRGPTICLIRTVDTDVVILIEIFDKLTAICQIANIWVALGTGKKFTYYHVNAFATTKGP